MSTTLRPYDELAQAAGLSATVPGISSDSGIGKLVTMFATNTRNKAIQRVIIFSIVGWSFLVFFLMIPALENVSPFLIFPLFCLGPIVVGAVVFGGYALLMNTLLGTPEPMMSAVLLRRGDTLQIHYKQPVKRNVTLKSLTFTLVLQESATYDQGTNTVTERYDQVINQIADFDVMLYREQGVDRQLSFEIPDNAMHSFSAYRNKLEWYLRVQMDIPNFPDYHRHYKLQVLPEVNTHES